MTEHAHRIAGWATQGPFVYDEPLPLILQELLKNTLQPDPEKRWTDSQAVEWLSGECVGKYRIFYNVKFLFLFFLMFIFRMLTYLCQAVDLVLLIRNSVQSLLWTIPALLMVKSLYWRN